MDLPWGCQVPETTLGLVLSYKDSLSSARSHAHSYGLLQQNQPRGKARGVKLRGDQAQASLARSYSVESVSLSVNSSVVQLWAHVKCCLWETHQRLRELVIWQFLHSVCTELSHSQKESRCGAQTTRPYPDGQSAGSRSYQLGNMQCSLKSRL